MTFAHVVWNMDCHFIIIIILKRQNAERLLSYSKYKHKTVFLFRK